MENILLKRATLADLAVVFDFEKNVNSKVYFAFTKEEEIKDYINNCIVYLIQRGNLTVGIISYENKNPGHISFNGLIVKPEFQKQGIATKAMTIALSELEDKKRVDLKVHPHNKPAIMVYLSLGFGIESWKDNYFGDGEPRIIMVYQK